jgi:hypothetical protein
MPAAITSEEVWREVEKHRGLKTTPEELAQICIIKVHPVGEFVTYGVGVSLQTMRIPEQARGRTTV